MSSHYSSKHRRRGSRKEKKISLADALLGGILALAVIAVLVGYVWLKYFQSESVSSESGPKVISTNPANNATGVSPKLKFISITFNKPMKKGFSFSTTSPEDFPEITGEPSFNNKHTTCKLPVSLQPNKTYQILLNSKEHKNFKSQDGKLARPYKLVFTTGK